MADMTNETVNGTLAINRTAIPTVTWTYFPIFGITILITSLLTNIALLWMLLRNPQLRTPFTIYIMNLLTANVINILFSQLVDIVIMFRPFVELGWGLCEAYLYAGYIVHAAVYNSHFFVALNRIWAVVSPMTYRHYHTKRFALVVSVGLWVHIHLVTLPGLLLDHVYHNSTLNKGIDQGQLTTCSCEWCRSSSFPRFLFRKITFEFWWLDRNFWK